MRLLVSRLSLPDLDMLISDWAQHAVRRMLYFLNSPLNVIQHLDGL